VEVTKVSDEQAAVKKELVNVFLKTDVGQTKYELPAGPIEVSDLKTEFGVPEAETLFQKVAGKRAPLANEQTIELENGMHFEAIGGGGVS
jgi:hypothetical protein